MKEKKEEEEEVRTTDNVLYEAAVSDLELALLSLAATICSSSLPICLSCHC